jgi:hypothetical protein
MRSEAATPEAFIASLPEDRKAVMIKLREAIRHNLPEGFQEGMAYGMLGYCVPHALYPPGYHANPAQPLPFISVASQKSGITFYHMGLYAGALLDWFVAEWPKHSTRKLDMGKSCVRFKRPEDMPLDLIGELCTKMTPAEWIERYESVLKR